MRIGILTQPLGENYGGLLQNWALQRILYKMGHEPKTIIYDDYPKWKRPVDWVHYALLYVIKYMIFHPTRHINKFPGYYTRPYKRLRRFLKDNIAKTSVISDMDFKKLSSDYKFDAYVVGSDQVWRPLYNYAFFYSMFCSFVPEKTDVIRLAYAASFGVDRCEFSEEQLAVARKHLPLFNAISVREKSGVGICKSDLGVDAEFVLDPTLLLNWDDYKSLVSEEDLSGLPEKFVGVYILDLTDEKESVVRSICKQLGMEPLFFGMQQNGSRLYPSVGSWLAAVHRSEFIITDSFHGTAFAINMGKSFYSIVNLLRGAERITSLLSLFNLEQRAIDEINPKMSRACYISDGEWNNVSDVLDEMRNKSVGFLKNNL